MLSAEFLNNLFNKQLKQKLDYLEERSKNETTCLSLLSTNIKNIESKY